MTQNSENMIYIQYCKYFLQGIMCYLEVTVHVCGKFITDDDDDDDVCLFIWFGIGTYVTRFLRIPFNRIGEIDF